MEVLLVLIVILLVLSLLKNFRTPSRGDYLALQAAMEKETGKTVTKSDLDLLISQLARNFAGQMQLLSQQVNQLSDSNDLRMETVRATVGQELAKLREDNNKSLEQVRATVDEKLQSTLEKRLGESFEQVGNRLEQVHKGLGEMQALATGVGDLQKLLRNVKIRGTWGEVQLGAILAQILIKGQYEENVAVDPMSSNRVEFAIALPNDEDSKLWLPIDAKCPLEDYERLLAAEESQDSALKQKAQTALSRRILEAAGDIRDKYIKPPYTTDFGILFLPIEGLYGEVLQDTRLCGRLQEEYRVLVAGPTTLAALLNVVQMSYRSLAIQERSKEVWQLLALVKQEFNDFGLSLLKTQKKMQEASNALEQTSRRTRVMERKLKTVEIRSGQAVTDAAQSLTVSSLDDLFEQ